MLLYGTQIWCEHSQDSGACPSIEQYGQTSANCNPPFNQLFTMVLVRYQGYVCPGILVTLAGEEEVSFLQSAWESCSILCPQDLSILRFVKDEINETQKNGYLQTGALIGMFSNTVPSVSVPIPTNSHLFRAPSLPSSRSYCWGRANTGRG